MLYEVKLKQYSNEVKTAVDALFKKAFAKQSHENDLLLTIIHGYYDEELASNPYMKKYSPYVFGLGKEGLSGDSQWDYYDWYRRTRLMPGAIDEVNQGMKKLKDPWLEQSINVQSELMVYLKFWESDLVLKQFYNLCRLIHGEHYDWHAQLGNSRKNLIEHEIKDKCRNVVPKFFKLIDQTYIRQIRNAAAHSQFRVAPNNLNLHNYDVGAGFLLKNISVDEWEVIFHKTVLLYNYLASNLSDYEKKYRENALNKHFGHNLRVTRKSDTKYEWIRLQQAEDLMSGWVFIAIGLNTIFPKYI